MSETLHQRDSKAGWRRLLRERRQNIDSDMAQRAATAVCGQLCDSSFWHNHTHIGLYLASDGELDPECIAQAAQRANKSLYLPVVRGKSLEFAPWTPGQALQKNRFGIGEPTTPSSDRKAPTLLLVPLVGFSNSGMRLGMGGGFYDRFLQQKSGGKPTLVGLAYECQRADALDQLNESWDIPMDSIVTEGGVYPEMSEPRLP